MIPTFDEFASIENSKQLDELNLPTSKWIWVDRKITDGSVLRYIVWDENIPTIWPKVCNAYTANALAEFIINPPR
jgi:hypothetical protein